MSNLKEANKYRREGERHMKQAEKLIDSGRVNWAIPKLKLAGNCFKMAKLVLQD
jgi:hypothetical protein